MIPVTRVIKNKSDYLVDAMRYSYMSFVVYFVLFSSSLISTTHYADAKRSLPKEEEDDIERQLKVLNKKSVKTITTETGDIIDCIDIYKQPAFDNPLLKDHKLQLHPSLLPGETTNKTYPSSSIFGGLHKEICPPGTVRIRRTTRDDLINAKKFTTTTKPFYANNASSNPGLAYHFVFVEEVIEGKRYYGATASLSTHELRVYGGEYSTSQIWIVNGPINEINSIEFGVIHHPLLFGDSLARLYGSWTRDGHVNTGCKNLLCPGFIQTSPTITFGEELRPSVYGQIAFYVHVMVTLNPIGGHWWLNVGATADTMEPVGYWPVTIFNHLQDSASIVRHGGFVSKTSRGTTPPMGNGFLPQLEDLKRTAYMAKMKYLDDEGYLFDPDPRSVEIQRTARPECYDIKFAGNLGAGWDMTMVYGGPGGMCA